MALADEYLVELGTEELDAWDEEDAARIVAWAKALPPSERNDALREAHTLWAASRPVIQYMISLPVTGAPGFGLARDADLAASVAFNRRAALANRAAGLNGRSGERNLRILDRICSLIAEWPEPDWSEAVRLPLASPRRLLVSPRPCERRGSAARRGDRRVDRRLQAELRDLGRPGLER